ncbi:hypothetical protein ACM9HC_33050 [Streptomyces sp. JAC18]|uniref:hypothetical protein n=1 Tax=Streptomyces sp. JAC18 TaxID=3418414 RepID=UPI003D81B791
MVRTWIGRRAPSWRRSAYKAPLGLRALQTAISRVRSALAARRTPQHAAAPTAADVAVADWEPFDPLRHHEHIHTRLPTTTRRPRPADRARQAARP